MKHIVALGLLGLLTACNSLPKNTISLDQYEALTKLPAIEAKRFNVQVKMMDPKGDVLCSPRLVTRRGQKAEIEVAREFFYPTKFDRPQLPKKPKPGGFPVTPTTPTAFEMEPVGTRLALTVETDGPFIVLSGTMTRTESGEMNLAGGEACKPLTDASGKIILTENRVSLAEFTKVVSHVYVRGLPGVEHRLDLRGQSQTLLIRVDAVK
jgi:hypothetical protein